MIATQDIPAGSEVVNCYGSLSQVTQLYRVPLDALGMRLFCGNASSAAKRLTMAPLCTGRAVHAAKPSLHHHCRYC
jgi:hypothetical protein